MYPITLSSVIYIFGRIFRVKMEGKIKMLSFLTKFKIFLVYDHCTHGQLFPTCCKRRLWPLANSSLHIHSMLTKGKSHNYSLHVVSIVRVHSQLFPLFCKCRSLFTKMTGIPTCFLPHHSLLLQGTVQLG